MGTPLTPKELYEDTIGDFHKRINIFNALCKKDIEDAGIDYQKFKNAIDQLQPAVTNKRTSGSDDEYNTSVNELKTLRQNSGIDEIMKQIKENTNIDAKLCTPFGKKTSRVDPNCFDQVPKRGSSDSERPQCTIDVVNTATNPTGGKKRRSKRRKNSKKRSRKSNRKSRRH